jgi:outer membrane protein
MNLVKRIKPLALLAGLIVVGTLSVPAQAPVANRFATVDMKKIFDSYYKTKQAEAQIKDRAGESDKVYKGMIEDYKTLNDEYKKLVDGSNDQALSSEEREKRKKSAENKLIEIQTTEKSVKQYEQQARTTIGEMEKRMREKIVGEIRDVVNAKARSGGFTMVFDLAAQTVYQTPFILFTNGENDLTDIIVKEMNATAPPETAASLGTETKDKPKLTEPKDKSKPAGK